MVVSRASTRDATADPRAGSGDEVQIGTRVEPGAVVGVIRRTLGGPNPSTQTMNRDQMH
jgi:hypothetical protein